MLSAEEVLVKLTALARPDQLEGMARYGISGEKRLGVSVADMRKLAKEAGNDHSLAAGLGRTGIPEAKILASMVDVPAKVTEQQMEDLAQQAGFRRAVYPAGPADPRRSHRPAQYGEKGGELGAEKRGQAQPAT